ncbi:multidrug transporter [Acidihalobacter yilgarnensis]|uniref:Multidrug transporter n=1 Tax=Acidihalobacter yilgarnensis TaxID=2819280 RepID=A0A1D8IRR8_9GAMM|nr:multidrug transporter [Acidihalobacter yilgarnensis]
MAYVYLLVAIISEVIATTALKSAAGFTRPLPSAIVVLGYGTAFYCLSLVLRSLPVSITYAIWSGLGIVLVTLAGALVYKQIPDLAAWIGMGLIIAGVLVINLYSRTVVHP